MSIYPDLNVVMETIDDVKDHMPEGKYLETCNALRRIYKKLRRPSIRIPITKKILFIFTGALSALKILDSVHLSSISN